MKFWLFWFVSIWFYASVDIASATDDINGKSPHEILFRAHLRKVAELNLKERFNPSIFVSYSWDSEEYKRRIHTLCEDLEKAGIPANQILLDQWANRPGGVYDLHQFMERIPRSEKVLLFGTPELKRKYEEREAHPEGAGVVSHEINLLRNRIIAGGVEGVIPTWFDGQFEDSFPRSLHHIIGRHLDNYSLKFFDLLWDIYQTHSRNPQNPIMEIKDKFSVRQSRLRISSGRTEFYSENGSFPQSLKAYNAFLDRTDDQGLSYLDVIFEELFMNEDERQFSTLTLCALSGMGGVGKTTLAIEFAYKYGSFYDLVYWIRGESRSELIKSCSFLLELLEIPVPKRPDKMEEREEDAYCSSIIHLVNENLSKLRPHWLLIIDNVEDPTLVSEFSLSNGHILCTSRHSRDWSQKLDVDVLKREESVTLLLQLTGLDPSFADQAGILAEELGDLPLALAQAAAYIKKQQLPTFEAYLDIYRASQAVLLSRQQIQPALNGKYGREAIVMTTWKTTMQKLSPEAQQLMSYFSYIGSDDIPLDPFKINENWKDIIEDTINELAAYSMIKQKANFVSLHKLVQLVGLSEQESVKQPAIERKSIQQNNRWSENIEWIRQNMLLIYPSLTTYWNRFLRRETIEPHVLLSAEDYLIAMPTVHKTLLDFALILAKYNNIFLQEDVLAQPEEHSSNRQRITSNLVMRDDIVSSEKNSKEDKKYKHRVISSLQSHIRKIVNYLQKDEVISPSVINILIYYNCLNNYIWRIESQFVDSFMQETYTSFVDESYTSDINVIESTLIQQQLEITSEQYEQQQFPLGNIRRPIFL